MYAIASYLRAMSVMKGLSIASFAALIAACFFPWITIASKNLVITGMQAEALNFGKPGLLHIVLCVFIIVLILLGRRWSLITSFFIAAFNIAWAVRNYLALSSCSGGECPEKQTALYLLLPLAVAGLVFLLLVRDTPKKG